MTAALFAVLAVYAALDARGRAPAWETPAVDPALMKASALMLVELALVTAVAIFFSTFTGPVLAAAFTFGLVIVGHFNADLKNFESVVESAPVAWLARALYYVLPNLAPFDVKLQVVHAQPVAIGYMALTDRLRPRLHHGAAARPRCCCSRGGTSNDRPAPRALIALPLVAVLIAGSIGLQVARDRRYATDRPAEQMLYVQSPAVIKRMALSYQALAADVYWIRALQHFGGGTRSSTTSERHFELLYPLLDLATTLDPHFNIAYRFGAIFLSEPPPRRPGPARPGDRAAAEGTRRPRRRSGSTCRTSASSNTGRGNDYKAAAEWFEQGSEVPGAAWFLKPLAATTLAQGGAASARRACCFRRSPRRARTSGCGRTRSAACVSSTRWTPSTQLQAGRRASSRRAAGRRPSRGPARRCRLPARRAARSRGYEFALAPWSGDVTLGEGRRWRRCHRAAAARRAGAGRMTPPAFVVVALALVGLAIGSFLNVCIYRIPRGESIVFPASRCTSCGNVRSPGITTCRS